MSNLNISETEEAIDLPVTFRGLGLIEPLLEAIKQQHFTSPTDIQAKCIPLALAGRDIIGVASTGSGKTAAFALPVLQKLWEEPRGFFACVLAPTHELAFQISAQFEALGAAMGVRCAVIVGGAEDRVAQAVKLAKRPHVIVATPGRLLDHINSTKGFSLRSLKFLVLDEADRLLDLDFGATIDEILKVVPKDRTTYLFSATMTTKVSKLQRASLSNPAKLEVSTKYTTVPTLLQYYVFYPLAYKEVLIVYLVNELASNSTIIFTRTIVNTQRVSSILRSLGFASVALHGQLSQSERLGALLKFKSGGRNILVATDVASRGLDIPCVDIVINYDVPTHSKDYIHRVGRTARAGRAGKAITIATQYDVETIQRLELVLGRKLELWPTNKEEMLLLHERVNEAGRLAASECRDQAKDRNPKRKRDTWNGDERDRDDDVVEADFRVPKGSGKHKMKRTSENHLSFSTVSPLMHYDKNKGN